MDTLIKFKKSIMFIMKIAMSITLTCVFVAFWQNYYESSLFSYKGNYVVIIFYFAILLVFFTLYGAFKIGISRLHEIIYSCALSLLFTNAAAYLILCLIAREMLPVLPILAQTVVQSCISAMLAYMLNSVYFRLYRARHILVVFNNDPQSRSIITKMSLIKERYSIDRGICVDMGMEKLKKEIDKYQAILICDIDNKIKEELLLYCYTEGKRIYMLPSVNDIIINNANQSQVFDTPVLLSRNVGLSMEQSLVKRIMDIAISLIGIIATSPIMLIVSLAIKICDGGPVLFKQNRVTKDGRIFNVYKFRSMIVDADKGGAKKATDHDDRITPIGRIIRPCRMDELPQLFNILFGSMSLVGPRPERTQNVFEYTAKFPEFNLRHKVKGGLTGYAQVYGKYNTTPEDKLMMDLMYIEDYSILKDIKLLIMTLKILFVKESTEGFSEESAKSSD